MTAVIPTLRRLAPEEADYLFALCEATMRGYVEQVWATWNGAAVRAHLTGRARAGAFFALYVRDARVGAVAFERHDTHYQIEDIYIEPDSQGQGIGTFVVNYIIEIAAQEGVPVQLRVLSSNPSRRLYERLGFKVIRSTPERHFLGVLAEH